MLRKLNWNSKAAERDKTLNFESSKCFNWNVNLISWCKGRSVCTARGKNSERKTWELEESNVFFLQKNFPKFFLNVHENICTWAQRLNLHFWAGFTRGVPNLHPRRCCNSPTSSGWSRAGALFRWAAEKGSVLVGSGCSREWFFPFNAHPALALRIILSGKWLSVTIFLVLLLWSGLNLFCGGISLKEKIIFFLSISREKLKFAGSPASSGTKR